MYGYRNKRRRREKKRITKWDIEKREIRDVALQRFYNLRLDSSNLESFRKWYKYFRLFDRIIEHESGDYRHFPTNNAAFQQPVKTMMIMDYMRELWIEMLIEKNKENSKR